MDATWCNGVFTLPDTETGKEPDKNVHTAQRQMPTQIHIGFCVNLSVSVSVSVSGSVNEPLG